MTSASKSAKEKDPSFFCKAGPEISLHPNLRAFSLILKAVDRVTATSGHTTRKDSLRLK